MRAKCLGGLEKIYRKDTDGLLAHVELCRLGISHSWIVLIAISLPVTLASSKRALTFELTLFCTAIYRGVCSGIVFKLASQRCPFADIHAKFPRRASLSFTNGVCLFSYMCPKDFAEDRQFGTMDESYLQFSVVCSPYHLNQLSALNVYLHSWCCCLVFVA